MVVAVAVQLILSNRVLMVGCSVSLELVIAKRSRKMNIFR
jgi:hypothetical protein